MLDYRGLFCFLWKWEIGIIWEDRVPSLSCLDSLFLLYYGQSHHEYLLHMLLLESSFVQIPYLRPHLVPGFLNGIKRKIQCRGIVPYRLRFGSLGLIYIDPKVVLDAVLKLGFAVGLKVGFTANL